MLKNQVLFTLREDIHCNTKSKIFKCILYRYRFWLISKCPSSLAVYFNISEYWKHVVDHVCMLENIQCTFLYLGIFIVVLSTTKHVHLVLSRYKSRLLFVASWFFFYKANHILWTKTRASIHHKIFSRKLKIWHE